MSLLPKQNEENLLRKHTYSSNLFLHAQNLALDIILSQYCSYLEAFE